jgi:hypothetical protein
MDTISEMTIQAVLCVCFWGSRQCCGRKTWVPT